MAVSDDGYWEIYLIPDTYGYIGGYLVYKGDAENAASPGKNNVSQINNEDLKEEKIIKLKYTSNGIENAWNKDEAEKVNGWESVLLKTGTEKLLLSKISYYELWAVEYGDTEEDLSLEIIWEKDGERKKSTLSAEYDRFNIHKYWGMFMDYTWKKEWGLKTKVTYKSRSAKNVKLSDMGSSY